MPERGANVRYEAGSGQAAFADDRADCALSRKLSLLPNPMIADEGWKADWPPSAGTQTKRTLEAPQRWTPGAATLARLERANCPPSSPDFSYAEAILAIKHSS